MENRVKTYQDIDNHLHKVIYFMTKTFRIRNNYSLNESIIRAKSKHAKLVVYIIEPFEANERNLVFWENLTKEIPDILRELSFESEVYPRNINLEGLIKDASDVLIDKPYLKNDISFFQNISVICQLKNISLFTVDSNVFVPSEVASDKEEYAARTIRSKIWKHKNEFDYLVLEDFPMSKGEAEAAFHFENFMKHKLEKYHLHNDPSLDYISNLSRYLKYGMISPNTIYHRLKNDLSKNASDFLEELIIRRELAYNFVLYNPNYDDFYRMTYEWAYKTMENHINDQRTYLYTIRDYLTFNTHDDYFNSAMKEMVHLGKMHSYMRMYWCKKIIEWSKTYQEAYETAMYLNNYYFYDGLTPNGYCGVAWCFGKHDRAWFERDIFGKLRYMNANGLKRKFDINKYVEKMNQISKGENE